MDDIKQWAENFKKACAEIDKGLKPSLEIFKQSCEKIRKELIMAGYEWNKLAISKSRVLEAWDKFPESRGLLELLFPEAFPKVAYFKSGQKFRNSCGDLFILIHTGETKRYTLVNASDGYWKDKDKTQIYRRTDKGIEIPLCDLTGMEMVDVFFDIRGYHKIG